jgi:hypothetical protein
MVTSLALTMLRPSDSSFLDDVEAPVASPAPGAAASAAPPAPAAPVTAPAASPAP